MIFNNLYNSVRLIVRTLPGGGEPLAERMCDEWIKRGVAAFEPDKSVLVVYRGAVKLLEQAIKSLDVEVRVGQRQIEDHERDFFLCIQQGALFSPPGRAHQPALRDILIRTAHLVRFLAPEAAAEPMTAAPTIEPEPAADQTMPEFLAAKLRKLYGPVRPGLSVDEMHRAILSLKDKDPTIGVFGGSTFKRAVREAWPRPEAHLVSQALSPSL